MGKIKFDDIAKESRSTYRGDLTDTPIVGLEHIEPYDILLRHYDSNVETTFTKSFKKGQILFGRRRAYQHKACVATFDGICSGDITVIEPKGDLIYEGLLPWVIQNDRFFDHAVRGSNGALSPRVKWEHMASFELNLPSMAEQKVLAEKLWAAYELKQSYIKMIAATDEMVKSRFIEMFGDTHKRTEDSRQWKDVVKIINGKDYKSVQVEAGGYPVYGTGGEMARSSEYLCPENSVLLGRKGTIDKPLLVKEKYWNVDTAFGVVPDSTILDYIYFFWHCKFTDFRLLNKGTTLPSTTKADLLNLWVRIPEMSKQKEFASFVEQADKSKFSRIKSRFIEMFGDGESNIHGMEVKTLGELCDIVGRIGFRGYTKHDLVDGPDEGAISLSPSNIINGEMDYSDCSYVTWAKYEESPEIMIQEGDILLVKTASVGKTALVKKLPHKATINPQFVVLKNLKVNNYYLSAMLKSTYGQNCIRSYTSGSTVPTLTQKSLATMKVVLPPEDKQKQIEDIINSSLIL